MGKKHCKSPMQRNKLNFSLNGSTFFFLFVLKTTTSSYWFFICIPTQSHILTFWLVHWYGCFMIFDHITPNLYIYPMKHIYVNNLYCFFLLCELVFIDHWYYCVRLFLFLLINDILLISYIITTFPFVDLPISFFYLFRHLKWVWSNVERVRKIQQFFFMKKYSNFMYLVSHNDKYWFSFS